MKNKLSNRKTVEIYFILYLAALILLIPDAKKQQEEEIFSTKSNVNFNLKLEKNTLNCIITISESGEKIINLDSVNNIFYTGDVQNVNFDFYVQDISLQHQIKLESEEDNTKYFKIIENSESQSAMFIWSPPENISSDRVYIVDVIAIANDLDSENQFEAKSQFSLNVNFINTNYFSDRMGSELSNENTDSDESNLSSERIVTQLNDLRMIPQSNNIKSIPYDNWENTFFISGMNLKTDMKNNPKITVKSFPDNSESDVIIKEITESKIILSGMAPGQGTDQVSLTIKRKQDNAEITGIFSVESAQIDEPFFSEVMHPGITYTIDPRLPILTNYNSNASIIDQNGNVLASGVMGSAFKYKPTQNDVGKVLHLVRKINNDTYGQSYKINIQDFPMPEVVRTQKMSGNKLRIYTNSYGVYKDESNYIERIEVVAGEISYREIIGLSKESNDNSIMQVFQIEPNDNKSLNFKIRLINRKGDKSQIFTYP